MFHHAITSGAFWDVSIDAGYSWLLAFGLIAWTLARYYPAAFTLASVYRVLETLGG
jgi:hypothetical protein